MTEFAEHKVWERVRNQQRRPRVRGPEGSHEDCGSVSHGERRVSRRREESRTVKTGGGFGLDGLPEKGQFLLSVQ